MCVLSTFVPFICTIEHTPQQITTYLENSIEYDFLFNVAIFIYTAYSQDINQYELMNLKINIRQKY